MEYLGEVRSKDGVDVDVTQWIEIIESRSDLASIGPREGINPFTGQPTVFKAIPSTARILVNGLAVGLIEVAQDGSGGLVVMLEPEHTIEGKRIANEIAMKLGAFFEEYSPN